MRYVHIFDTVSAFTEKYTGSGYTEPWVSYTKENNKVDYNKGSFNIRVAAYDENGELVYNDSFSKSLYIGHLTAADFDFNQWCDWAQSVYYNEDGYAPVITEFPSSLYTNDFHHLFEPYYQDIGPYENNVRVNNESNVGATVNEGAMNRTFTIIMARMRNK